MCNPCCTFHTCFRKEHVTALVLVPSSALPAPSQDDVHSYFSGVANCNLPRRWWL